MHVVVQVKHAIVIAVIVSVLSFSPFAEAQTTSRAQQEAINEKITLLLAQVKKLQKQLAQLENRQSNSAVFSYKTKFYKGTYEALYTVTGDRIIPQEGKSVRKGDQLLWETFVDIVGESFVEDTISEFRVYNKPNNGISAFVEEKPDNTWIFAFNREGKNISDIYADESVINLLVHEFGHLVFFDDTSIEKAFKKTFWSNTQAQGDFITQYASNNATEDLAETFVYFVTHEKPTQKGTKYDKVRFLYQYPELLKIRSTLRESDHL